MSLHASSGVEDAASHSHSENNGARQPASNDFNRQTETALCQGQFPGRMQVRFTRRETSRPHIIWGPSRISKNALSDAPIMEMPLQSLRRLQSFSARASVL